MSSAIKTVSRPTSQRASNRLAGGNQFFQQLALAYRVYRERRALMGLSTQALKDIGLSKADAYREGSRSIWDLPTNRTR
jgi:uncharacterized protein YjiS (DUF1127 family)